MKKSFVSAFFVMALTFLFSVATPAFATSPVGTILMAEDAWAERNGDNIALELKAKIFSSDNIYTSAKGKVQVLFNDDTTVSLGPDSTMHVHDFVFGGAPADSKFSAGMTKGLARFVTGKIVEQNRSGFSVKTPQATVGIRGTTFTVQVLDTGITTVVGLNVTAGFPIEVSNNQMGTVTVIESSGFAVDASPSGNTHYQAPPGQLSMSSSAVRGNNFASSDESSEVAGSGTSSSSESSSATGSSGAVASTGGSKSSGQASSSLGASTSSSGATTGLVILDNDSLGSLTESFASSGLGTKGPKSDLNVINPDTSGALAPDNDSLASLDKNKPNTPDTPDTPNIPDIPNVPDTPDTPDIPDIPGGGGGTGGPDHSGLSGTYSGSLVDSGNASWGTFSFDVSLTAGNGDLSNAKMDIGQASGSYAKTEQIGSVPVTGGSFNVRGEVTDTNIGTFNTSPGAHSIMDGNIGTSGTSGTWDLNHHDGTKYWNGGFDGTKQ